MRITFTKLFVILGILGTAITISVDSFLVTPKINYRNTECIHRNACLKTGIEVEEGDYEDDAFGLDRMGVNLLHIPMYAFKLPVSIGLGIWSSLFWRVPTEKDLVNFVEGTSLITVLRRGTERNYYVDVKECLLVHNDPENILNHVESWSMTYTKIGKWDVKIHSFIVNGKPIADPARRMSFLHMYAVSSAHPKCHVYGNALVRYIKKDKKLLKNISESTWNTIWLHRGLLSCPSPLTFKRTNSNKWAGIFMPITKESLVAETSNMSPLGGYQHGIEQRWIDLDLPLSKFMLKARTITHRAMVDHDIPMELYEAIFLSVIMHSTDHVLLYRLMWGLKFGIDPWDKNTVPFICESSGFNFMWVNPTLNPVCNNRIKNLRKPFYRQLYRELKKIDTLNVVDDMTASIMY